MLSRLGASKCEISDLIILLLPPPPRLLKGRCYNINECAPRANTRIEILVIKTPCFLDLNFIGVYYDGSYWCFNPSASIKKPKQRMISGFAEVMKNPNNC